MMAKNPGAHVADFLFDKHNCDMLDNVRPVKWTDPEADPALVYDMVVIGGGAGGLVTAVGSSIYGAKACMIERSLIGGDCLVSGCVPSKAFLKACNVAHTVKTCSEFGVEITGEVKINFKALMDRMKKIRADISNHDAAKNWTDEYGLDIYMGHAKFASRDTVEINGSTLRFAKACIATGGRPHIPDYPGIQ